LLVNPAPGVEYNAHPPTSVLLALLLAWFDYPDAVLVWNIISVTALAASLWTVARQLALPWTILPPTLALLAFCHPVYGNVYEGQLTLILVLLVTVAWVLERTGSSGTAGLLLGTAAAIKLFPAYLVVCYGAQGQRRLLLTAAFAFLTLTVATAMMLGVDTYLDYLVVVLPAQSKFPSCTYNMSIAGFWHKLFNPIAETGPVNPLWLSPPLAHWGTVLTDLIVTVVVALLAHRARSLAQRDLSFALAVIAMLLVSPVTWDLSLPLLLVPIAVTARYAATSRSRWLLIAVALILMNGWIPQSVLAELERAGCPSGTSSWTFTLGAPSLQFYGLLGIFGLGLRTLRAETRKAMEEADRIAPAIGNNTVIAISPAPTPG
jgi:alpha-1,2-mannosyltransferase